MCLEGNVSIYMCESTRKARTKIIAERTKLWVDVASYCSGQYYGNNSPTIMYVKSRHIENGAAAPYKTRRSRDGPVRSKGKRRFE